MVRRAHGARSQTTRYGWTFRVEGRSDPFRKGDVEALLRIEVERGWCYYGFVAVQRTAEGPKVVPRSEDGSGAFADWAQRVTAAGLDRDWHTDDAWWLAWTLPAKPGSLLWKAASWLAPGAIRTFMQDSDGTIAADLADDIRTTIDEVLGPSAPDS